MSFVRPNFPSKAWDPTVESPVGGLFLYHNHERFSLSFCSHQKSCKHGQFPEKMYKGRVCFCLLYSIGTGSPMCVLIFSLVYHRARCCIHTGLFPSSGVTQYPLSSLSMTDKTYLNKIYNHSAHPVHAPSWSHASFCFCESHFSFSHWTACVSESSWFSRQVQCGLSYHNWWYNCTNMMVTGALLSHNGSMAGCFLGRSSKHLMHLGWCT